MEYKPKVILCRLHMADKSIQQIREECAGQGMTYRDFENIKRANEYFDGVRCRLSLWEWDNYKSYHLDDWDAPSTRSPGTKTTLKNSRLIGRRGPMTPAGLSALTRGTWRKSK